MKNSVRIFSLFLILALLAGLLSGCSLFRRNAPGAVVTVTETAPPTPTQAAIPTPAATPVPTPAQAASNLPRVTKSPTGETVPVGGKCQFVTRYENATWAEWHFVSPDGTRDIDYTVATKEFPTMKIVNGYAKDMTLENIPALLNGWKVYCRFSNDYGSVKTDRATITVTGDTAGGAAGGTAAGLPKVTKSPTGETVNAGGSAWFVAKYQDAIWAVWHFVSPDGTRDLAYTDAAAVFQGLKIIGGDQSTMQLQNIPTDLNGWKVYCSFRNNAGSVNTDAAAITVTGAPAAQNTAAAQTQPSGTVIVAQNTSSGYTGTYVESTAGRGTMEITGSPSLYNVHVRWSGSASTYWTEFRSDASADNTFFQKQ